MQKKSRIKNGSCFDFSTLTEEEKEKVINLTAAFLSEICFEEYTAFVINYAAEKADRKICPNPAPFFTHIHLYYFLKQINEIGDCTPQ